MSKSEEAINAALEKKWSVAVTLNKEIIDFDNEDISALNRLGKAYLELGKFTEAKKVLKNVLKLDPINHTATKNLEHAINSRKVIGNAPLPIAKSFIKEPGTTREYEFILETKGITAKKFYLGEPLEILWDKNRTSLNKLTGELLGFFSGEISEKLDACFKRGGSASASFMSGEEKTIKVLIKSTIPIFKGEKQELKPYIKVETADEDEDETPIDPMLDTE